MIPAVTLRVVVWDREQAAVVSIELPGSTKIGTIEHDVMVAVAEKEPRLAGAPIRSLIYQSRDQPEERAEKSVEEPTQDEFHNLI